MPIDRAGVESAVRQLLRALGRDPETDDELRETPRRVAEAFAEDLLSGRDQDLASLIAGSSVSADDGESGLVIVRDVSVATVCPHHLLPAVGTATVAYRPGRLLVGLGAIARLANACARRLILQEVIGREVVDALMRHAGARGALCELSMMHTCLAARGAKQSDARVETVATAGELAAPGRADALLATLRRPPRDGA